MEEEIEETAVNVEVEEPIENMEIEEPIVEESPEVEEEPIEVKDEKPVENKEPVESTDNSVVERAYSMIGSPYSWGGTTSDGFDCSGFVSYCLSGEEGTRLGTTETFSGWTQVTDPQPGDVCVVHNDSSQHTGIYVGDGNMVHAATYGVGVIEGPVQDGMIYVRYE